MQTQISIFNFESTKQVRTAIRNGGDIWFCLPDVATILNIKNSRDIVAKQLDKKGVEKIYTLTVGGQQELTFINEPNLYRVIFRSNKAEAVKFQNWVFDEVLPAIRKTGQYRHTISVEQQAQISQAVARRCQSNRRHYQTIYSALHQKFNIPRYSELLASDFDTAMSFIRNYGFNNNGDNNGYEQLYIALTDSVTNIRAYLKLIKSLKELPFMDENVARKMYHDGQDTILRIAKIAQALDLQNTQGKPMFEPGRLNYYGGAALFYR